MFPFNLLRMCFANGMVFGVIERHRTRDLGMLVRAMVIAAGTPGGAYQGDVLRSYLACEVPRVARSACYRWFDEPLEPFMAALADRALAYAWVLQVDLTGILGGVKDYNIVDSTTVCVRGCPPGRVPWRGRRCGARLLCMQFSVCSASARSRTASAKRASKSSGFRTCSTFSDCRCRPNLCAVTCSACHSCCSTEWGCSALTHPKTATRAIPGMASLSSSSDFVLRSWDMDVKPVTFPPRRDRLATKPCPTGSAPAAITMGMFLVACMAAWTMNPDRTTMRSTWRPTISAARSGYCSGVSARRTSKAMCWPST